MWSNRILGVKQFGVFQEVRILVVGGHKSGTLRFNDFPLDRLLFFAAQARNVPPVDSAGVGRLELGQHPNVLVIGRYVVLAQYALNFVLLERILHVETGGVIVSACISDGYGYSFDVLMNAGVTTDGC